MVCIKNGRKKVHQSISERHNRRKKHESWLDSGNRDPHRYRQLEKTVCDRGSICERLNSTGGNLVYKYKYIISVNRQKASA